MFHSSEHINVFAALQLLRKICKSQENATSTAAVNETEDNIAWNAQASQ